MNNEIDLNNFMKSYFNFGVIVKTDVEGIKKIKEFISSLEDTRIIYHKIDSKCLKIISDE